MCECGQAPLEETMEMAEYRERLQSVTAKVYQLGGGTDHPDTRLFHYTSARGLQGILQSQAVLASHLQYMNDLSELVYATGLIEPTFEDKRRQCSEMVCKFLAKFSPDKFRLADHFDVYGFCFTEARDDLAAWMTYSNSGHGYAIEFDPSSYKPGQLWRVLYDDAVQRETLGSIIDDLFEFLEHLAKNPVQVSSDDEGRRSQVEPVLVLHKALAMCATRFKHKSFGSENEWRLIAVKETQANAENPEGFRVVGAMNIPYVEFRLPDLPVVVSVWLGPNVDEQAGRRSVELILSKFGYCDVEVKKSSIPLRSAT